MNINGSSPSNLQKTIHLSRVLQCADTQVTCSGAKEKHKFGFIIRRAMQPALLYLTILGNAWHHFSLAMSLSEVIFLNIENSDDF